MADKDPCSVEENATPLPDSKSLNSLITDFVPFVGNNKEEKVVHKYDVRSHWLRNELANKLQVPPTETTKNLIELQLEKIDARLDDMIKFGNELINNVKIHSEKQELIQRRSKQAKFDDLQLSVKAESEDAMRQFEDINAKWGKIMELNEPMIIHQKLEDQKVAIEELMKGKDKVIDECQQQFKRVSEKYYVNIQKQSDDMCFLIDRVNQQINEIKKAYNESFKELETAIESERQRLGEEWRSNWNNMFEKLKDGEEKKLLIAKEKQRFYAEELRKICVKQEEITRATKIRMEKDAEQLEVELRKTRYNILMNSEKIDYNYQVLQKRNEENVILNNQQKRRVAKLKESIAMMKDKLNGLKHSNKATVEHLTQDIQKLHDSIKDLQIKAEQSQQDNIRKFNSVWRMHFKEIKDLLFSIGRIEQILHNQQFMLPWKGTYHHMDELDIAKISACRHKADEGLHQQPTEEQSEESELQKRQRILRSRQFRDVLWKISDRAGFLVESKLTRILEPFSEKDKCIVRIENIFTALHITDIETVELLLKFFEYYSYCPNCVDLVPIEETDKSKDSLDELVEIKKPFLAERQDTYSTYNKQEDRTVVKRHPDCPDHYLVVEPTLVLTALNDFTTTKINKDGKVKPSKCSTRAEKDTTNLLSMDVSEIKTYWDNVSLRHNTDEKMRLWDMLEHGLNHYLVVLKEREQLDGECKTLEVQNAELKYFLKNILSDEKKRNDKSKRPSNERTKQTSKTSNAQFQSF